MRALAVVHLASLSLAATACGASPVHMPDTHSPAGVQPASYGDDEVSIDGIAWADMDRNQRAKYMADVVMPTMATVFTQFDPGEYTQGFSCATCHGTNATEVDFAMPNDLHPLDPAAMPSLASDDPEEAKWVAFMQTKVAPKMAKLLGEPLRDPDTGKGFGCFDCHEKKGE